MTATEADQIAQMRQAIDWYERRYQQLVAQNATLRGLLVARGMPDAQIDLCLGGAS